MMAVVLVLANLSVAPSLPSLAEEAPAGTSVALRVMSGEVIPALGSAWQNLAPLLRLIPETETLWRARVAELSAYAEEAAGATGCAPYEKGTSLTLVAELGAPAEAVFAIIMRGPGAAAAKKVGPPLEGEAHTFDGHTLRVLASGLAWARTPDACVIGNERGVQRQLRHWAAGTKGANVCVAGPLCGSAQLLREDAPVLLAWASSPALRAFVDQELGLPALAWAAALTSVSLRATGSSIVVKLTARTDKQLESVKHAALGVVAALEAAGRTLVAGAELSLAGGPFAPKRLRAFAGAEVAALGWLRALQLAGTVRSRPARALEIELTASDPRGLLAAVLLTQSQLGLAGAAGAALPEAPPAALADPKALLLRLRVAELAFKARSGRFLACPPEPPRIPARPVAPSPMGCLAELGFATDEVLSWQLAAELDKGKLMLFARGSPAGGPLEVWYLDETAATARRAGAALAPDRETSGPSRASQSSQGS